MQRHQHDLNAGILVILGTATIYTKYSSKKQLYTAPLVISKKLLDINEPHIEAIKGK